MLFPRIDTLLRDIEAQREVIEQNLKRPARWRGILRRELCGRMAPVERARVAAAFNRFTTPPFSDMPLNLPFYQALHDDVVGGFDFRATGARVRLGKDYSPLQPPPSSTVEELVARALDRATDGLEHPVLAAARLHLELLLIHPFSDGNGRTARLISSLILVRAGYRSTLLTAVEQHFAENPPAYTKAFLDLGNRGGADHWSWLAIALEAMAAHSRLAFLYRTGEWSPGENDAKTRRDLEAQLARITEEEQDEALRPAPAPISNAKTNES